MAMEKITAAQQTNLGVLARRRARQLGVSVRFVTGGSVTGAYYYEPLSLVEFCLHEAAHLITLGHEPSEFPKLRRHFGSLTEQVTERGYRLTKHVADALELDTAIITYFAGFRLGYWDDPEPIIKSCTRNMSHRLDYEGAGVRAAFEAAINESLASHYRRKAELLAEWFGG